MSSDVVGCLSQWYKSFQLMKISQQVFNILIAKPSLESGHGANPVDDGIANLLVGGRRAAGQRLRLEQVFELGKLLLEFWVRRFVTDDAILLEEFLSPLSGLPVAASWPNRQH